MQTRSLHEGQDHYSKENLLAQIPPVISSLSAGQIISSKPYPRLE